MTAFKSEPRPPKVGFSVFTTALQLWEQEEWDGAGPGTWRELAWRASWKTIWGSPEVLVKPDSQDS